MELQEKREPGGWKVEIVREGRSISRLWIVDVRMRIGSGVVQVGGIAGVGTDRKYRNQGLARRVLEASLSLMRRERYDASFLFGIQDFYHKFGFATCMPEHNLRLETRDAERAPRKMRMRPYRKADLGAIARLYNRQNATRTGAVVRDPRTWKGVEMGSGFGVDAGVQVVVDGGNQVRGYVVYDAVKDRCRAAEVGGQGEAVFNTLLGFLARRAVELRREEVSLSIPPDHPLALHCRQFGCRVDTQYPRHAGPMGRIVAFTAFMQKLLPELNRRWEGSEPLGIATDSGACVLQPQKGGLRLREERLRGGMRLGQEALMQLFMGYCTAEELLAAGRLQAPRRCGELLSRLFPLTQAHMWWPDRF